MAGAAGVRAGRAFIQIDALDKTRAVLNAVGSRFRAFGAKVTGIGAAIVGAGTSILAPLAAAVRQFAASGDRLDKMSARTGVSAQALAELGFAAEQSGSDLNAVEKSIRRMQQTIGDAGRGLSTAKDGLAAVGLTADQLAGKSPEDQFEMIADGIAKIEDPTKRAHAAMMIFGSRQGTALLPMLENLRSLREEARELGLAPSDEDVSNAAKLTDAFNRVKRVVGAIVFNVGAALAKPVLAAVDVIVQVVKAINEWINRNRALVQVVAAVGVGLVAAGAAVMGLGLAITFAGVALSGLASLLALAGSVLGFLLSPVGLLVGGLAGLAAWFFSATDAGRQMVGNLVGGFMRLWDIARTTLGGISDAIRVGDWQLAGKIALAGLKVVMLEGALAVGNAVGGVFGDFLGKLTGLIAQGKFAEAWDLVLQGMFFVFGDFIEGVVALFTTGIRSVLGIWEKAVNSIAKGLLAAAHQEGAAGSIARTILGRDPREDAKEMDEQQRQRVELFKGRIAKLQQELEKAEASGGPIFSVELDDEVTAEEIRAAIAQMQEAVDRAQGDVDTLSLGFDSIDDSTSGIRDGVKKWTDELDRAVQARNRAAKDLPTEVEGGLAMASDELADARRELDQLRAEATEAAEEKAREMEKEAEAGVPDAGRQTIAAIDRLERGSAAAFRAAVDNSNRPLQRQLAESVKQTGLLESIDKTLEGGGAVSFEEVG